MQSPYIQVHSRKVQLWIPVTATAAIWGDTGVYVNRESIEEATDKTSKEKMAPNTPV